MNILRFLSIAAVAAGVSLMSLGADRFAPLPAGAVRLEGELGRAINLTIANRLKKVDYVKLVDPFRYRNESDSCWRCEFWGKIVRSTVSAYRYTADPALKAILDATVQDLIATQTPEGRITSYPKDQQLTYWDLWGRKYVLLALVRYCEEVERNPKVVEAILKMTDDLIRTIGNAPGKKDILDCGAPEHGGLPASSVLCAIVDVYRLTKEPRVLEFAKYIAARGCSKRGDIVAAALKGVPPTDLGNGKAYELTSCFRGLAALDRFASDADVEKAIASYRDAVAVREIMIHGTGGARDAGGEYWDNGAFKQTLDAGGSVRFGETCITTEWIRYNDELLRLFGGAAAANDLEKSFYNALLGAFTKDCSNCTHGNPAPLGKADSGLRGYCCGYSFKSATDDQIKGFGEDCCLAMGPEGLLMAPRSAVMMSSDGLVLNCYEALTAKYAVGGEKATLRVSGGYPFKDGPVTVTGFAPGNWTLKLRIPSFWGWGHKLLVNAEEVKGVKDGTYFDLKRIWKPTDTVTLVFDLIPREEVSPDGSSRALLSGPLVLAADSRFTRTGSVDVRPGKGWRRERDVTDEFRSIWRDDAGTRLTDYASAGNRFNMLNRLRVWFDRPTLTPYAATLGGKPLPLETARISALPFNRVWPGYQRPENQTKTAKFVQLDLAAPTALRLMFKGTRPTVPRILPMSRKGRVTYGADWMEFALDEPEQFIVDFGDEAEPLHVFVNAPWKYEPKAGDIYFGPGTHDAGVIAPKSGQRVVLDHGAVVYGAIFAYKADNVEVIGRGILDSSRMGRQDAGARAHRKALGLNEFDTEFACGAFVVYTCNNFRMEGVVIRDTPFWSLIVRNGCRNVDIRNVKVIGQWRYNSDGFDICASEDVTIRDSFLRTFDDCVVARGPYLDGETTPVRNMLVENCNLWCDWGKNMEVWAGHLPGLIENVTYRKNRLLNVAHIPADVTTWYGSTSTVIRNIRFEDIELDLIPNRPHEVFQAADDQPFRFAPWPDQTLFEVTAYRPAKNLDNQKMSYDGDFSAYRLNYDNIVLKGFRVYGDLLPMKAYLQTEHPGQKIRGVRVEDMPAFSLAKKGDVEIEVANPRVYLKVGTSNVKCPAPWDKTPANHWKQRAPFLFDQWRAQNPDILGLQEPVKAYLDDIRRNFPGWTIVGDGRDGGDKGEFSAIAYRTDRFEELKNGTFWLSGRPAEVGSIYPGANHPRICTFAYLKEKVTGKIVAFCNSHTSYMGERICAAQIRMMTDHLKANAPKGAVCVLTGDLNFEGYGEALRPATEAGLVNADDVCLAPLDGLWNSVTLYRDFPASFPAEGVRTLLRDGLTLDVVRTRIPELGARIDHIWVTPNCDVVACGVDDSNRGGWYPSDHMAKFAVIGWRD